VRIVGDGRWLLEAGIGMGSSCLEVLKELEGWEAAAEHVALAYPCTAESPAEPRGI